MLNHLLKIKSILLFFYSAIMPLILIFVMAVLYRKFKMTFPFLYLMSGMVFLMNLIYFTWIFAILKYFSRINNKILSKVNIAAYIYILIIAFIFCFTFLINFSYYSSSTISFTIFQFLNVLFISSHFYLVYSATYVMRVAELNRPVRFSELIADIVSIYIFPIGLWVYQPRLRELFNMKQKELSSPNRSFASGGHHDT